MNMTAQDLASMGLRTVTEPRAVAEELMAANVPVQAVWPALIAVVLLSTVFSGALNLMSPAEGPLNDLMSRPFMSAFLTFSVIAVSIYGLHWGGRMFGGEGRLNDMVLVTAWLQAVLFVAQLALIFLTVVLPPLGALMFLALLAASVWMTVSFVDAVHRFNNLLKSLGVIFFVFVAVAVGLSILLAMIGAGSGGLPNNV